ncbi:hypothetical protein SEA_RENAUD18_10 [Mycobacterium phage Renaud18]|uniref:Head-to-tail connector protein n=1 Tax=Mycobacterium phage Renaud18 TaxID=2301701 RepID=A0A385DZL1_9CAUD|nr:head-tail connector protein [Mycobacterium phage Renaud18]AXQ64921.1 hypothetical protein SEA_RENAUD18_10 [Mycobacterium phage Renaud18]
MSNPLRKYGIKLSDIDKLPEVNDGVNDFMESRVVPAWRDNSPVESGAYRDSIQVTERSTTRGRGKVAATADHAHLVEFGSAHNPEYAPAEKTAKQFGGYAHDKS